MSYKSPSGLGQRSSPFRRPASPASPSSGRGSTPPSTSRNTASPMTSPSKLKHSYTVSEEEEEESMLVTPTKSTTHSSIMPDLGSQSSPQSTRRLPSPPKPSQPFSSFSTRSSQSPMIGFGGNDPLSRLPPALLASLRESFSVLDPNSTGTITPSSVHETLQSLGLDTSTINTLFPPGSSQSLTLPQYLNSMATILVALSPQQELLNAFSAFDDDDSGQIDVVELKRALMTVPPEQGEQALSERDIDRALDGYTGRRILGRNMMGMHGIRGPATSPKKGSGDVFRYQEFVGGLMGSASEGRAEARTA